MKLHIFTIVLDGMPQITWHLPVFNRLVTDWHWHIVHGVAENLLDTAWCERIAARLSQDGTSEYLETLHSHPRVSIIERPLWPGKTAMCNAAINQIHEECILLQIDADELWTPDQIERLTQTLEFTGCRSAQVYMRYFVGPNIVTKGIDSYGNNPGEWQRAWRYSPGMKFVRHEPPILDSPSIPCLNREETRAMKIVPDHYAYVFEHQVQFKETYYRYPGALQQWKRLQAHAGPWPVKLKDFLPWVDDRAQAGLLHPMPGAKRNPGDGQP